MHMRMSSTPDAVQSNDTQRSSPPSSSVHGDRPLSASPPAATSSLSPKITNIAGASSFAPPSSTIGFTKPAISSAQSSLFFPHLTPAASLAAASSTAAFYSGLRNLQQFQQQQQHAAAVAAAALQATASPPGNPSTSQTSPPLFNGIPSLRLPTSSGFVPISMSPKCLNDRISDPGSNGATGGGASPPRTSPRSISAFSVESNS